MNTLYKAAVLSMLMTLFTAPGSWWTENSFSPWGQSLINSCMASGNRAMKQRGQALIKLNDDIIRRTLRAYGGDYIVQGKNRRLIIQGKTYRDFEISIVDSRYLVVKTVDAFYHMEIVKE